MTLDQRIAHYTQKANDLLRFGDANPNAEGRRALRDCKRYRLLVRELQKERTL